MAAAAAAWADVAGSTRACPEPLPAPLFCCCSTGGFEEPLIVRHPQAAAAAAASEEAEGTSAGLDGVPPGGASMERGEGAGADYEPWLVTYNYSQVGEVQVGVGEMEEDGHMGSGCRLLACTLSLPHLPLYLACIPTHPSAICRCLLPLQVASLPAAPLSSCLPACPFLPAVLLCVCPGLHVHCHADDGVGLAGGGGKGGWGLRRGQRVVGCVTGRQRRAACVHARSFCRLAPPRLLPNHGTQFSSPVPPGLPLTIFFPPPAAWPPPSPPLQYLINVGWTSVWVKVVSQWVTVGLYCWTLVAPLLFPDRDFN
jgi:hypothetical protein